MFQVLGENYKIAWPTAQDMVAEISKNQKGHLKSFVAFCMANKLQGALQRKDWVQLAKSYNGSSYLKFKYPTRLEAAYAKYKK